MQKKVELPDQIPIVMESGIHPLPTKWAMNVIRIAGNKDPVFTHSCYLPVMDWKIAAPVEAERFNAFLAR